MMDDELIALAKKPCEGGTCGWSSNADCLSCWALKQCKKRNLLWSSQKITIETEVIGSDNHRIIPILSVSFKVGTKVRVTIEKIEGQ